MNPVLALYRATMPTSTREYIARKRSDVTLWFHPTWRELVAKARVAAMLPVRAVNTGHGTVYADLRDYGVGRQLFVHRGFEVVETRFVRSWLRPGMAFLDIGANIGYYTTLAAAAVGDTGSVVAIEPDPYNFSLLTRGLAASGCANVSAFNVAAGSEPGTARLYRSSRNWGDHRLYSDDDSTNRASVDVTIAVLDELYETERLPLPDVVKIDVQGFEDHVMQGMSRLLSGDRPLTVLSEYWPHGMRNAGGDPSRYLARFCDWGFSCHHLTNDGRLELVAWDEVDRLVPAFDPLHPDYAMVNLVFMRFGR